MSRVVFNFFHFFLDHAAPGTGAINAIIQYKDFDTNVNVTAYRELDDNININLQNYPNYTVLAINPVYINRYIQLTVLAADLSTTPGMVIYHLKNTSANEYLNQKIVMRITLRKNDA